MPSRRRSDNLFARIDAAMIRLMSRHGVRLLRVALGVVFVWFGALKVTGTSPVVELIRRTVYWVSPDAFIPFLGWWEIAVGIGLTFGIALRLTLFFFWLQMAGTFLVLVVRPDIAFQDGNPLLLTTEGEFVVKNLVLIAGGLAVGGTVPRPGPRAPDERGGARVRWLLWFTAGALTAAAAGVAAVAGTTRGSLWFVRQAINRYVPSDTITIREARGTLLRGFEIRGVEVPGLDRYGVGMLRMGEASVSGLWPRWLEALQFHGRDIEITGTRWVDSVTASEVDGRLGGGVELRDVRAAGILRFPRESTVEVQRIVADLPPRLEQIREVHNGRLRLPYAEPVVFYGRQDDGRVDLRVYTRTLDVHGALQAVSSAAWAGMVGGTLSEVNLRLAGTHSALAITGRLRISRLTRRDVSLLDAPVQLNLAASGWPGPGQLVGDIGVFRALLEVKHTTIRVDGGTITFDGDAAHPAFDLRGGAAVGGTPITITLKGTRDRPELKLTSDPPLPQTALLIMLATGKPWRGTQEAITQGEIPLDLATEFIDYVFFGGIGGRFFERFGISDIAVRTDAEEQRIGVETTFRDRLNVGVEMGVAGAVEGGGSAADGDPTAGPVRSTQPYKIGAEYKFTNTTSVALEGEHREQERSPLTDPATAGTAEPAAGPEANDTVLLKLKRRF